MGKAFNPPQPMYGTATFYCTLCGAIKEESGFENELKEKKVECSHCGGKMEMSSFHPFDPSDDDD